MASVFHAVQEGPHGFDQEVAIKLVHPELLSGHPHVLQMLVDEARIAARIKHVNVVRILDLCQDEAGFYMVMDYVDGLSLRQVLDVARSIGRPAPLGPVLDVLAHACYGLDAAHNLTHSDGTALDLVHRDIKPGNILVGSEGDVKVADFGIALFTDRLSDQTSHGQMKGTPAYMSPEQALGDMIDRRSDIFSMGMTLYTMATSELAFTGETGTAVALKITQESMEPHAERLDSIAHGLGDVLRRCCAKEPAARFQSAADLSLALSEVRVMLDDATSVSEMLAGAGWRPWDPKQARPVEFLGAEPASTSGAPSLLGDEDEPSTLSDDPVSGSDSVEEDLSGTVVDQPMGEDLEVTPVHPRVELLLPGEGPSKVPLPPNGEPSSGPVFTVPRSASVHDESPSGPPSSQSVKRFGPVYLEPNSYAGRPPSIPPRPPRPPGSPPGPPSGPPPGMRSGADPLQTTGHGRRVLPERDYRGRVIHREVNEAATRVSAGEKLMVAGVALLVLLAVALIIRIGLNENPQGRKVTDPVDLDGNAIVPRTAGASAATPEPPPVPEPDGAAAEESTMAEAAPVEAAPGAPAPEPAPARPKPAAAPPPSEAPPPKEERATEARAAAPVTGPGALTVNTYPWAKVYVNGEDLGRTPLVGHSLEAGQYALRLVVPSAGDKEINETVTVTAGEETRIVKRIKVKESPPEE